MFNDSTSWVRAVHDSALMFSRANRIHKCTPLRATKNDTRGSTPLQKHEQSVCSRWQKTYKKGKQLSWKRQNQVYVAWSVFHVTSYFVCLGRFCLPTNPFESRSLTVLVLKQKWDYIALHTKNWSNYVWHIAWFSGFFLLPRFVFWKCILKITKTTAVCT